ncbi:hypothetical protein SEA_LOZINAK_2 [Gordonia phage Lozinak]|uniref:Uncharacterized protein n=4 Tax=Smoothievirus TaxID=1982557 RepID=A0A2D1GFL2_9CAUD|nr:hypothetical protein BEN60_gp002 [Gordonia phage Smoothie]YP_009273045.1 hypothetical protein BH768_gp002 [Gordonia phage ClubL]YP_009281164.1 hypothetical protein BIZ74_gp002 [Gordonia phage Cucurbita]ATN90635.1 hypothetical protein SEA_LOZINAK_2 [Gordonia phage Lozinak]AUE23570.1 hypothetical protein SEA_TONIANN_2 [Gordonia phage Toniann]QAU06875.1 hypothetical protein SEA_APHELION_2 [Gordonia phage Aphelion]QKY79589.1 hypothetical protein SEA_ENGINEER_2 [Gordonia Phage Engineer]QYC5349
MSYITVRFEFKDIEEDDESTYRRLCCARRVDTDLDDKSIERVTESLGQSDQWHTASFGILEAMESTGSVSL